MNIIGLKQKILRRLGGSDRGLRVGPAARQFLRHLRDQLAPQLCLYCDQPTRRPAAICAWCNDALLANDRACPRCALPYCGGSLCPTCQSGDGVADRRLTRIIAPWIYDEAMAYLVQRWKYGGDRSIAELAAFLMISAPICCENYDIVTAVPLHWRRQLARGFNQSADLLAALCRAYPALGALRVDEPHLVRRHPTPKQSLATRAERMRNMRHAFVASGRARGMRILIVDDVCTTTATGEALARAWSAAGAESVTLWCLARTPLT